MVDLQKYRVKLVGIQMKKPKVAKWMWRKMQACRHKYGEIAYLNA